MALQVNSVPLSETISPGLPRRAITVVSSRATRRPEIDVSGMAPRHSLVTSSTILRMRKRRPLSVCELVVDEVQRPARIRPGFHQDRRPAPCRLAASPPLAGRKSFFPIEPANRLIPDRSLSRLSKTNSRR